MKKQSQNKSNFRKARMNLNFYSTKDYENEPRLPAPGKQTPGGARAKHKLFDLLSPPFAGLLELNFVFVYFNDFDAVYRVFFVYYFSVDNSR